MHGLKLCQRYQWTNNDLRVGTCICSAPNLKVHRQLVPVLILNGGKVKDYWKPVVRNCNSRCSLIAYYQCVQQGHQQWRRYKRQQAGCHGYLDEKGGKTRESKSQVWGNSEHNHCLIVSTWCLSSQQRDKWAYLPRFCYPPLSIIEPWSGKLTWGTQEHYKESCITVYSKKQ